MVNQPESNGDTPRWVKIFASIALALVLLVVVLHLTGLAPHGHMPSHSEP